MRPKKILIFSIVYGPHYVGGAEMALKEVTNRIASQEVEFHMVTLRRSALDKPEEKMGNILIHRIGYPFFNKDIVKNHKIILLLNKLFYPGLALFKANSLQRRHSFNALLSLMANYAGFAAYFFKILHPKIPFILSLQEGDSEAHLNYRWGGLVALSWKLTLQKADFLAAISTYLLNRAKNVGFTGEAHIISNGVDINKFTKEISKEEKIKIREELGLKEGDVALITSSRLNIKNGIGNVIEAMKNLPENIKFIICGTGELEKDLKLEAISYKLEARIKFLGFVSHDQLPKYLKACDIFIRPSLSEGMGNSFIEAMAAGIPVIATPVGGIVDFLREEDTGYLCKPGDLVNIAETVNRVIADPNKNRIIENAYNLVVRKYDWNQIAEEMKGKIFSKI